MDILIVGASARAAAQSARRAGLTPAAIDLFADSDLAAIAATHRVDLQDYPQGLPQAARSFPPGPFLYTGGLENHPDVLAAIARERPLWGIAPATLQAIRDPLRFREVLHRAGLPTAEVRDSIAGLPRDGSWLLKPRDSAGGLRIRPLEPGVDLPSGGTWHAQKRLSGRSLGALFLATTTRLEYLGATESRQGVPGAPFAYAGSVGPVPLSSTLRDRITAIGRILAFHFDLRGLFGVDLIEREDVPIPVEINPRYTASVEILEHALGLALLADHRRAFENDDDPAPVLSPSARIIGKAIVYARAPLRFPNIQPNPRRVIPRFADLPAPGTPFSPGDPILTVFARGRSVPDTHRRLDRLTSQISRILSHFGEPFSPESRTM